LEANVPALVVTVNGNARRQLAQGQTIILPAGRHELEISRPGYETVRRSVRVAAERTRTIEVTLDPLQPLPSELAGVLEVHINHEGALITVDGRPLPDGPLPVGPHRLTVRHSNFLPWSRLVQVVPGSTVVQRVQLEPTPGFRALQDRRSRWWRIGTGATLSVALATLGATFCLLVWNSIRDQEWTNERNELRADFAQVVDAGQDTRALQVELERNAAHGEDLQAWASAEWALFAVGLTAAIASAVLLLRENKSRRAGLRWRPAAGGFSLAWGGPQGSQGSP
jgi:hypothetical protein